MRTPASKLFAYEFALFLKVSIPFLKQCRPFSTTMGNSIKYLKSELQNIKPEASEQDVRVYHNCDFNIDTGKSISDQEN